MLSTKCAHLPRSASPGAFRVAAEATKPCHTDAQNRNVRKRTVSSAADRIASHGPPDWGGKHSRQDTPVVSLWRSWTGQGLRCRTWSGKRRAADASEHGHNHRMQVKFAGGHTRRSPETSPETLACPSSWIRCLNPIMTSAFCGSLLTGSDTHSRIRFACAGSVRVNASSAWPDAHAVPRSGGDGCMACCGKRRYVATDTVRLRADRQSRQRGYRDTHVRPDAPPVTVVILICVARLAVLIGIAALLSQKTVGP